MKNFLSKFSFVFVLTLLLSGCGAATTVAPGTADPTPATNGTQDNPTQDVAEHNTEGDCWVVIDGKMYDVTSYIPQHPGGPEKIIKECGKDATAIFDLQHKPEAKAVLQQFYVADVN